MIAPDDQMQKRAFRNGEGDAWWARNSKRLVYRYGYTEPVMMAVMDLPQPRSVLEIGCAGGGRLALLWAHMDADCSGIDPSREAIEAGREQWPELNLKVATADKLPHLDDSFDIVIFGFCLYLVDRGDLFKVVSEADRVLRDGGHLVIYDFAAHTPHRVAYHHRDGIYSYKADYAALFAANPAYTRVSETLAGETIVQVLRKDEAKAYPVRELVEALAS